MKLEQLINETLPSMSKMAELYDLIKYLEGRGAECGLISDDFGHWAISCGMQNVPETTLAFDGPNDVETTFFVEKSEWKDSILEALIHFKKSSTIQTRDTKCKDS